MKNTVAGLSMSLAAPWLLVKTTLGFIVAADFLKLIIAQIYELFQLFAQSSQRAGGRIHQCTSSEKALCMSLYCSEIGLHYRSKRQALEWKVLCHVLIGLNHLKLPQKRRKNLTAPMPWK